MNQNKADSNHTNINNNEMSQLQIKVINTGQYIKKMSFQINKHHKEVTKSGGFEPQLEYSLGTRKDKIDTDEYEVTLQIGVKCKNKSNSEDILFTLSLDYVGIFTLSGEISDQIKDEVLFVYCTSQIFPFARREIAAITTAGGYLPVLMDPIDFAQIYKAYLNKAKQEQEQTQQQEQLKQAQQLAAQLVN